MTTINLTPDVALKLETITAQMSGKEFSGIGFARYTDGNFEIYDAVLISVGSEVYTEIPSEKLLKLMARSDVGNMKVWFHRHGVGDGIPGPHNWSSVDSHTATEEPLGCPVGMAHLVKWSISIVRTPYGWVGRYDTYKLGEKAKTVHLRVTPSLAQALTPELNVLRDKYHQEHSYARRHNAEKTWGENIVRLPPSTSLGALYEGVRDFDPERDLQDEEDELDDEMFAKQLKDELNGLTYTEAREYLEEVYGYDNPRAILTRLGITRQSTFLGRLFQ